MEQQLLNKYAQTILTTVGLQKGQYVVVNCEPINRHFALVIAEHAYRRGAAYVAIEHPIHLGPRLNRIRADYCPEEYLDLLPASLREQAERRVEEKWVHINLMGEENPECMEGVAPERSKRLNQGYTPLRKVQMQAFLNARVQWQVAYLPTPANAARIYGSQPDDEAAGRAFEALAEILQLGDPDPADRWTEKVAEIERRARALEELELKSLRFTGPGTDLEIGMTSGCRWKGGTFTAEDGTRFIPNLPTEEVFTSPDFRRVNGRAAVTRPVLVKEVGNQLVDGAWFEFKDGKVVDYGADRGKHVLDELLSFDEGARRLGEVALVDGNSSIFRSGLLWNNTLLDENAACHIALGNGLAPAIEGGEAMSEEELTAHGINSSKIHTDFMIGSPQVDVTAAAADGRAVEIIKDGVFQL